MASVRIPKLTIGFEIETLNDEGLVEDSRTGNLKLHEAAYDIKVSELVQKLVEQLIATPEERKAEDNG